ncbi:MAG: geranylgeranylglyceryl/heptaprenylglyceryl phosphate synthase [Bacteroidetes bacterium]|nr:geranylgeranylglyceryl/heptaprenylglyceryl phosphate synthase [Bacteroidota bacterium]
MSDNGLLLKRFSDGKKKFASLIDPDKFSLQEIREIGKLAQEAEVDFLFYGGSLVMNGNHKEYIAVLKEACSAPVILFPGNQFMIVKEADGLLLLSLISGRNAEMLIGRHVSAAPYLKTCPFEILPTGYMLIESGRPTAVSYMSDTAPIPSGQDDIAVCTAMAGELLGLKLIYMDAGSGADNAIRPVMIEKVRQNITIPLIIGGGIRTPEQARAAAAAGADLIVVGNAIEKDRSLVQKLSAAVHSLNQI